MCAFPASMTTALLILVVRGVLAPVREALALVQEVLVQEALALALVRVRVRVHHQQVWVTNSNPFGSFS